MPGVEVALEPLDGVPAQAVAIPAAEPVELCPVRGVEAGEVAVERLGVDEPGLELAERGGERVGEPGEARGAAEAVQRDVADDPPDEQAALGIREDPATPAAVGDPREEVVEGADRAAEERRAPREQIPLDPLDVRPVRHDEDGLASRPARPQDGEISLRKERDFARVGGPDEQAEAHRSILDRGPDGSRARRR